MNHLVSSTARPKTTDAAKTVTVSREIPVHPIIPKISATGGMFGMRLTSPSLTDLRFTISNTVIRNGASARDLICVVTVDVTPADVALYQPTLILEWCTSTRESVFSN
jgi:hypothetical protein